MVPSLELGTGFFFGLTLHLFEQRAERDEVSNHVAFGRRAFPAEETACAKALYEKQAWHTEGAARSQCGKNRMNKGKISRGGQRGDWGISAEALMGHGKDFDSKSEWQGSQWTGFS